MTFRYEHYDITKAGNETNPFHADDAISESLMRYSQSSLLAIALTVACSAVGFSGVANAQNAKQDFPWRSKTSAQAVVDIVKPSLETPTRDLTTGEVIATPTPTFEAMPEVIYDEGKKYVRRGDTYIESTDYAVTAGTESNFATAANDAAQMPAVKKSSLFQKTKDLTSRLNPFSKSIRSETAYRSSDWKVPSFSKSLSSFSKKDNDPITFAAVTPLPAKSAVPASLDSVPTMLASSDSYTNPALPVTPRDNQFKSALPTETKLTSVFSADKAVSPPKDFQRPAASSGSILSQRKLPSSFSAGAKIGAKTDSKISSTSAKDFQPKVAAVAKLSSFSSEPKSTKSLPLKTKITANVVDQSKGFTFTQQVAKTVNNTVNKTANTPTKAKPTSALSLGPIGPKARSVASKSAIGMTQKVSQDFSPVAEVISEIGPKVSPVGTKVAKPIRPAARTAAHALSVENEFWTPKR